MPTPPLTGQLSLRVATLSIAMLGASLAAADPSAEISSVAPVAGEEALAIHGTADANHFKRAWLVIGKGSEPTSWRYVGAKLKRPIREGRLSAVPLSEFEGEPVWTIVLHVENADGEISQGRRVVRLQ